MLLSGSPRPRSAATWQVGFGVASNGVSSQEQQRHRGRSRTRGTADTLLVLVGRVEPKVRCDEQCLSWVR
jgi:hypothetical protein